MLLIYACLQRSCITVVMCIIAQTYFEYNFSCKDGIVVGPDAPQVDMPATELSELAVCSC